MRTISRWLLVAGLPLVLTSPVLAEDVKDLIGTWTWTWTDAQQNKHTQFLEVEGAPGKIAARERLDDLPPVKVDDLRVDGKTVTFSVLRGARRSAYHGLLKTPKRIEGLVTVSENEQNNEYGWSADLVPPK